MNSKIRNCDCDECGDAQVMNYTIPEEITTLKIPNPILVDHYKDWDERAIYIDYDIDESLFAVTKQILSYNRADKNIPVKERKPIHIYIHSYGGDLHQTNALISTMLASKTPIITVNMGVAMSAGFIILLAGHKRYAMKYAQGMCHQGSGGATGTYDQMEEQQKNYKKLIDGMRSYILERTSIDSKTFGKNKSKDWYMSADEMLEYGVVGKVVDSLDEIL